MNTRSLAGCSLPQPAPAPAGACGAEVWEQLEALGLSIRGCEQSWSDGSSSRERGAAALGEQQPWQSAELRHWQGSCKRYKENPHQPKLGSWHLCDCWRSYTIWNKKAFLRLGGEEEAFAYLKLVMQCRHRSFSGDGDTTFVFQSMCMCSNKRELLGMNT